MSDPLSNVVPGPRAEQKAIQLILEVDQVEWLDGVAERTGRNRSDVAREIFRNVRAKDEAV